MEQSDQRVVTPYALKQHGDALGSLIWDCFFFFFFFVQRYIDDCLFCQLVFGAVNAGTHGAESHTAHHLEMLNSLSVGL